MNDRHVADYPPDDEADPTCQVCRAAAVEVEAILFPTDANALFAMLGRHAGYVWPSVKVCQACAEATVDVFRVLTALPPRVLVEIELADLVEVCREYVRKGQT